MAPRFYAGNPDPELIDQDVFDALRVLDDSYSVFFEVAWGRRSSDIAIIRACEDPMQLSTLIVTEIKHFQRAVRGTINDRWEMETDSGDWEPLPGFEQGRDTSPYWQAVNTANIVSSWLYNYQRFYRDDEHSFDVFENFRTWPDLLILSPQNVRHRLPFKPDSGYGMWFYDIDSWVNHLQSWEPKEGTRFTQSEISRIAEALHVQEIDVGQPAEADSEIVSMDDKSLQYQLDIMNDRLTKMSQEMSAIRTMLENLTTSP